MKKTKSVLSVIHGLNRPVFTTREISLLTGKSVSTVTQTLNYLSRQEAFDKIHRGVWGKKGNFNAYDMIPFLLPNHQVYVSFVSALHLHGLIDQIPQVITCAAPMHSRLIRTRVAHYRIHQIEPSFFKGFDWHQGTGRFLIAEPEKALADSLYLSVRKKRNYGSFPELHLTKQFRLKKVQGWIELIKDLRVRSLVYAKLEALMKQVR